MLTQKLVKELFSYLDGKLIRNIPAGTRGAKGDIVGGVFSHGYVVVTIKSKHQYVHRVVFLMHYGYLPKCIDHIDGDRENNRIENLRGCTQNQNMCNRKLSKNNISGIKGVGWHKNTRKWRAGIKINGKFKALGYFLDKDVAEQVVRIERIKLHGEFANHG